MYIFEAHYTDMDNNEEIIRKIEFDGQFMENSKESYMYAMSRAYDLKKENECLATVEFIAC
jgi:hypothetical protein